jgi:hypothetical protein
VCAAHKTYKTYKTERELGERGRKMAIDTGGTSIGHHHYGSRDPLNGCE